MEDTRLIYHSPDLKPVFQERRPTHTQSALNTDFSFAHLKLKLDCFSLSGTSINFPKYRRSAGHAR